ncbi:MAG: PAS domain-containing protein [Geminicoccaceae bacterium]|nr:PAS domain-containing protein [Geminicoccaceae bacterium]
MRERGYGETAVADEHLSEAEREQSIVISDPTRLGNPIIFVSDAFERQTGYPPHEALGHNCRFLQGPDTDPDAIQAIREALGAGEDLTVDILNYKKDGTPFWNRLRLRALRDERGRIVYFAGAQNPVPTEDVLPKPVRAILD